MCLRRLRSASSPLKLLTTPAVAHVSQWRVLAAEVPATSDGGGMCTEEALAETSLDELELFDSLDSAVSN